MRASRRHYDARMKSIVRTVCELVHLGALGIGAGALAMTGAAAAIAFPTMKSLSPVLPGFKVDEAQHWSIAAGSVMNRVFGVADVILLGAVIAAAITLSGVAFIARRGIASMTGVLRCVAVVALCGAVGFGWFGLRPRMQGNLESYWSAAREARVEDAAKFKAAFDADHPRASMLLTMQFALCMTALGFGGWNALSARGDNR